MTHDIINQLTVIYLGWCELRSSIAEKLESSQLADMKRLELAVLEVAQRVQQLRSGLQDNHQPINGQEFTSAATRSKALDYPHPVLPRPTFWP